jgi:hypothetical protein
LQKVLSEKDKEVFLLLESKRGLSSDFQKLPHMKERIVFGEVIDAKTIAKV